MFGATEVMGNDVASPTSRILVRGRNSSKSRLPSEAALPPSTLDSRPLVFATKPRARRICGRRRYIWVTKVRGNYYR